MSNTIETAIEATGRTIPLGKTHAAVIAATSAYGLFAAGRDASRLVRKIRANRKTEKVVEETQTTNDPQS